MKYIMEIEGGYDVDVREFENSDEALKEAEDFWRRTSEDDKKTMKITVLESVNPDVNADNHYDGNPIKIWGEQL